MTEGATVYRVEDQGVEVITAALVAGDGVDLVLKRPGRRSVTVQLSMASAKALSRFIRSAAEESERL